MSKELPLSLRFTSIRNFTDEREIDKFAIKVYEADLDLLHSKSCRSTTKPKRFEAAMQGPKSVPKKSRSRSVRVSVRMRESCNCACTRYRRSRTVSAGYQARAGTIEQHNRGNLCVPSIITSRGVSPSCANALPVALRQGQGLFHQRHSQRRTNFELSVDFCRPVHDDLRR